jgi:DNA-binding NarL/FixJ family response regulator
MIDKIKIALIDDEPLFVEGLTFLFKNVKNIVVAKTATNGYELLDDLENISEFNFPDIILVDIQMKPLDGFDLVEMLKKKYSNIKIIILSSHYKTNVVGHMIKLGVSAFIPKNANKKSLITAIESVYEHGIYFSKSDQEMLIQFMGSNSKRSVFNNNEELSNREIEVLKLICNEYTSQEIADKLFISKRTVEGHRQKVIDKIGAKNTVGLVIYAIANKLHTLSKF